MKQKGTLTMLLKANTWYSTSWKAPLVSLQQTPLFRKQCFLPNVQWSTLLIKWNSLGHRKDSRIYCGIRFLWTPAPFDRCMECYLQSAWIKPISFHLGRGARCPFSGGCQSCLVFQVCKHTVIKYRIRRNLCRYTRMVGNRENAREYK